MIRAVPSAGLLSTLSLAPDSLASLFGVRFTDDEGAATTLPLPTELAGVRVLLDDQPLDLLYAGGGQVNVRIPAGVSGLRTLTLESPLGRHRMNVLIEAAAPAIFSLDGTGTGPAAALNAQSFALITDATPIAAGDYAAIYVTGIGDAEVEVLLGNLKQQVLYAGPAPGFPGLQQVNFQVRGPSGSQELLIRAGGRRSNATRLAVEETRPRALAWEQMRPLTTLALPAAALALPAALALLGALGCAPSEPLSDYGAVPPFELIERSGRAVTLDALLGKVWVADFVFTTCAGPCPLMSANMKRLQTALPDSPDVRLVTFTVDPERDTPEALAEYARRYGADAERWLFLTGDKQALYDLIRKGFLQAVDDGSLTEDGKPGPGIITHSTRYTLIDRQGRIRGFYFGAEDDVVDAILPDLRRLLQSD